MAPDGCRLVEIPTHADERGGLGVVEGGVEVPFAIARAYWIYGVPAGAARGEHAHRALEQLFVPLAGALTVEVDDGTRRGEFRLDRPDRGLYVPSMIWRRLLDFTADCACLVLASKRYDADDYVHDYDQFVRLGRD